MEHVIVTQVFCTSRHEKLHTQFFEFKTLSANQHRTRIKTPKPCHESLAKHSHLEWLREMSNTARGNANVVTKNAFWLPNPLAPEAVGGLVVAAASPQGSAYGSNGISAVLHN